MFNVMFVQLIHVYANRGIMVPDYSIQFPISLQFLCFYKLKLTYYNNMVYTKHCIVFKTVDTLLVEIAI